MNSKELSLQVEELKECVRELSQFMKRFAGANDESVMEIKFNGEHSDLYANTFAELLTKVERLAGCDKE